MNVAYPRLQGVGKKKTKVVRIIARLNVGGPAVHCELLSRRLSDLDYETVLVTGQPEPGEKSFEQLFPLDTSKYKVVRLPLMRRSITGIGDLRVLASLVKILRREKPDIVHTHTAKAGTLGRIAAFLCRVPVVVHTYHGHVLSGYFSEWLSRMVQRVERVLAWKTSALVTLSPQLKKDLSEKFNVAPAEKFHVIPLGRDLSSFLNSPRKNGVIRREFKIAENEFLLGIIGRLVPIKNHSYLFESLAGLKSLPFKLLVVGDGPLRTELEQKAKDLGFSHKIIFTGWRSDLQNLYSDLDLFLLSSLNEGTPLSIIESFAAGCPVLSTQVGGVADMFTDKKPVQNFQCAREGALVPSEDRVAMANAIQYLYSHPSFLTNCSIDARSASRHYSEENLASRVAALYKEQLTKKGQTFEMASCWIKAGTH